MRKVAEDLMPKFFDNLGLKIKARIAAGVLRLPANATSSQQASAVLQNSGPLVQKLFQLMGDQTDSKELAEVMALLKENIQPIEQKQILAALNHRFGAEGVKKYFANISGPKKSGSVGQVHFATDTKTGEKIVVKVRRPGVVEDLALEAIAMNEAAKGTDLAPFAEKIVSNVGKELDFREESKNLVEGALYVDANRGIGIAKIIDHVPVQEDVLVMQLAPGASVAKFTSPEDLVKRGQAVTSLLEDWVKHSVSQSGFFHGDLHAGNIFLDTSVKNKQGYQLTLIDFGNAGRITREEQAGFIKLLSGIVFKSPEDVASAFESIGSVPEANRAALLAELKEILKRETTYPIHQWFNDILQDIGKAALTNKVDVPESFLAFQRGKKFLENELDLVNRLLDEADPAKKLPRFDPTWAQVKSLLKETQHNAAASLLGKQKPDSMLSLDLLKDIFKIWRNSPYRSHIKSVCQRYYRALGQLPY
jgi:ubiquinone biosynthesis protein